MRKATDKQGISFYVASYLFASYAAGSFFVKISWKELGNNTKITHLERKMEGFLQKLGR